MILRHCDALLFYSSVFPFILNSGDGVFDEYNPVLKVWINRPSVFLLYGEYDYDFFYSNSTTAS